MKMRANVRERRGLSILLTLIESIGLTGGLNDISVEGQVTTITAVVAAVVATIVLAVVASVLSVVLTIVLSVILTVVAAVLTTILSVLAVVLALTAALTTKLGVGNTGRKQQRDEGREAHDDCSKNKK
jgi:hypothetical protein